MRILFVCGGGYVYGKEIITISLINGLRKRGHEVTCLTSTWSDGSFPSLLEEHSIPFTKVPLGFISKTLSWSAAMMTLAQIRKLPRLWLGYRRAIKEFEPDVVLHSTFHHIFLLWPLLKNGTNVFHVHDFFPPTVFYRLILRLLDVKLCSFVGVSKFIACSLEAIGIPRQKINYILNGLAVANESNKKTSNNGGGEERASPKVPVSIGIVGQVGAWKGHDDLIDALNILKKEEFVCRIYGNGHPDYVEALKNKIEAYGLSQVVHWAGFVELRSAIYPTIDICVIPSRSQDPCPTVALEAGHFGLPAVATRRGGLPEIIRDGETGYLVDLASPEQIAEKLRELINDSDLRLNMGNAARRHASLHFTSDRMSKEMESLLFSFSRADHRKTTARTS